jgi:hypothetical protein
MASRRGFAMIREPRPSRWSREIADKSPDAIRAAKRMLNNLSIDPGAALLAESTEGLFIHTERAVLRPATTEPHAISLSLRNAGVDTPYARHLFVLGKRCAQAGQRNTLRQRGVNGLRNHFNCTKPSFAVFHRQPLRCGLLAALSNWFRRQFASAIDQGPKRRSRIGIADRTRFERELQNTVRTPQRSLTTSSGDGEIYGTDHLAHGFHEKHPPTYRGIDIAIASKNHTNT